MVRYRKVKCIEVTMVRFREKCIENEPWLG
jgi:hypothetical protein